MNIDHNKLTKVAVFDALRNSPIRTIVKLAVESSTKELQTKRREL